MTTWAKQVMAENPEKQYLLLSAATALQQMRVSGLPSQTYGTAFIKNVKHVDVLLHVF